MLPSGRPIFVNLLGPDPATLSALMRDFQARVAKVPGIAAAYVTEDLLAKGPGDDAIAQALVEALHDGLKTSDNAPAEVEQVDACALSGELAGPDCPHARIYSLAGRAPHTRCALHVRAWVADDKRVGPSCPTGTPTGTEASFVQWPSNVARYLSDRLTTEATVPDWAEGCTPGSGRAPRIISPGDTEDIVLIPGVSPDQQEVALEAEGEGELVWYVDGALLARGQPHERQWWTPAPGKHTIAVMDASGSTTERTIGVHEAMPN